MIFNALAMGRMTLISEKRIFNIIAPQKEKMVREEEWTGDDRKSVRVDKK